MNRRRLFSVFCLLAVTFLSTICHGQIVPFKGGGQNNVYSPATGIYEGPAHATHFGKCHLDGLAIPTPTADPLVFDWTGLGTLTAPDGSQIFFAGGGQVQLIPLGGTMFSAAWYGDYDVTGGTRRFANVGPGPAPLEVLAINHPFDIISSPEWFFDWTLSGQIDLGRKK